MSGLRLLFLVLLTAVTLVSARRAQASLLVEPYLGYEMGKYHIDAYQTLQDADWNLGAGTIGARLGFAFPVVFIAADYSTLVSGKLTGGTHGYADGDASGDQLFADVGVRLPLLRAYVGYGFTNTFKFKQPGTENKAEGGPTFKVGVGTTIFPMVAVGVEYIQSTYDKVNGNSAIKSKSGYYNLQISVPLMF